MKSSVAMVVLAALAASPALAQQNVSPSGRAPWRSPGEPLAAAQTTREYVPNRDVVRAVQQRLSELGYPADVSGSYDANLRNNILRFQSNTGLRPTGEVDLSTIGALGINVEPVGVAPTTTAMATPVATTQTARLPPAYNQLMERDEYMSSAQVRRQPYPVENTLGLELGRQELSQVPVGEVPPGFPPDFPVEDLQLH